MYDIAQAAIGMDGLGPVEFIPKGYNGAEYATMKYANGIIMQERPFTDDKEAKGIKFIGDKGWLKVTRGYIECSDSTKLKKQQEEIAAGQYEVSSPHMQNFIDAIREHKDPIAPVEYGCSTNTLCCLFNIARELQRGNSTRTQGDGGHAGTQQAEGYCDKCDDYVPRAEH